MALEEMFRTDVLEGAIFYHMTRRREPVSFDDRLRNSTINAAKEMHELFRLQQTPPPEYGQHCLSCSLYDYCMPSVMSVKTPVYKYMAENIRGLEK